MDDIKMDFKNRAGLCDSVNLAQKRIEWRSVVTTAKNVRFREMAAVSWLAGWLSACQCTTKYVQCLCPAFQYRCSIPGTFTLLFSLCSSVTLVSVLGCRVGPSCSYRPTFRRHDSISLRLTVFTAWSLWVPQGGPFGSKVNKRTA